MSQVVFEFRENYHWAGRGVSAQVIGEQVEAIKKRHATEDNLDGDVLPKEVFESSRPPDAPLHPCFTWDKDEAAYKHNIEEARRLIRCYEIHILPSNGKPIVISPANVVVRKPDPERGSVYVSASYAMSDEERKASVLADIYAQLSGIQRRLQNLEGITSETITHLNEALRLIAEDKDRLSKASKKPAKGKPEKPAKN